MILCHVTLQIFHILLLLLVYEILTFGLQRCNIAFRKKTTECNTD